VTSDQSFTCREEIGLSGVTTSATISKGGHLRLGKSVVGGEEMGGVKEPQGGRLRIVKRGRGSQWDRGLDGLIYLREQDNIRMGTNKLVRGGGRWLQRGIRELSKKIFRLEKTLWLEHGKKETTFRGCDDLS